MKLINLRSGTLWKLMQIIVNVCHAVCRARSRRIFAKRLPKRPASRRIASVFGTAACGLAKEGKSRSGSHLENRSRWRRQCDERPRNIMAFVGIQRQTRAELARPRENCSLCVVDYCWTHDEASWGSDGFDGGRPARVPWVRSVHKGSRHRADSEKSAKPTPGSWKGCIIDRPYNVRSTAFNRRSTSSSLRDTRTCTFNGKYRWRITRTSSSSFIRVNWDSSCPRESLDQSAANSSSTKMPKRRCFQDYRLWTA